MAWSLRPSEKRIMSFMFYVSASSSFCCNDVYQSIKQEQNNIEWTVQLTTKNNEAEIVISSKPIGDIACLLVPWTVTFNVWVSNTYVHQYDQRTMKRDVETKRDAVTSAEFAVKMNNYVVKNNDVSLKVEITNIRWKGIHKFQVKNFDSTDADEDLVLNVDGEKLHCHSQILSQNSTIFRDMIKGSQGSCEISLKDSIPVEDLRELLHYLYLPCEPVDDHNLRQLLHWGRKFEVKHVVQLCQHYMESLVVFRYTALEIPIEIFLLFWRYIRHSKNYWVRETIRFKSSDWLMKIFQTELYQDMDKDRKLQMCELLIRKNVE